MTLKEKVAALSQLRMLRREVDMLSQRVAELERAARGGAGRITGMPGAARRCCRLGDAEKLAALSEKLEARRGRCMDLLGALYDFIDGVADSRMRMILTCRYIDGDSWLRVAFRIGECDEQYPRRLHNRFLEQTELRLPEAAGEGGRK